ncbi:MAG: hypothetical protein HWD59_02985 [Coxiellaceae bacterium]|nr:MAG: hypothetical protein HWD59_02985 [Coxiellaceae bacterium]
MGGQFGFIKEALNYYIKYPFESRFLGKYCAIETNDVCREEMLTYRKNFGASSLLEGLLNHVSVIDLLNFLIVGTKTQCNQHLPICSIWMGVHGKL